MVFLGGTPIGAPIAGWVAEHFGARTALGMGAVVAVLTGLVGLWIVSPAWRRPVRRLRARRADVVGVPAGPGRVAPQLSTDDAVAR
jgi:MFS family permease